MASAAAAGAVVALAGSSVADGTPRGAREKCSTRSEASFPGAFTRPRNLAVGPLALVGAGARTSAETVRRVGGNKFPALVKAGHSVVVRIPRGWREHARLGYGRLPQGEVKLGDAHVAVKFTACRPGGPSESNGGRGVEVTFWSGFILTDTPACIPLNVYADGAAAPRRVSVPLGRSCAR
jgi:hypothetical protein